MEVTLDAIFGELLEEYPETEQVLKAYMGEAYCLTCPGKMFDTIGNGVLLHGMTDEMTQDMIEDLQAVVDAYENGTPLPEIKEVDRSSMRPTWDGNYENLTDDGHGHAAPVDATAKDSADEIDTSGVDIDHMFAAAIKELEAQEKEDAGGSTLGDA